MAVEAVSVVARALAYSFEVFTTLLDKTGLTPFYLAMAGIALVVAYLLSPFLVSARSDTARSVTKALKSDNGSDKGSGK